IVERFGLQCEPSRDSLIGLQVELLACDKGESCGYGDYHEQNGELDFVLNAEVHYYYIDGQGPIYAERKLGGHNPVKCARIIGDDI
ncbi:hypothetical protein ACVBKF_28685, partial [Shewanella sp. 0m-11]